LGVATVLVWNGTGTRDAAFAGFPFDRFAALSLAAWVDDLRHVDPYWLS
jgi:hypothetical protein